MCKVNNLYSMYHGSVIMNIEKMVEIGLLFEQYKELLTDIKLNGIKITNIKLRTTKYFYNIIKERSKKYE